MGMSFSCPFAQYSDDENSFVSVLVKSISFGVDEPKRPLSFTGKDDVEPKKLESLGSRKMVIEGSISFNGRKLETKISFKSSRKEDKDNTCVDSLRKGVEVQSGRSDCSSELSRQLSGFDHGNPKHEAAIKLQKVYKSFRTRRKLADCAVLVEQSWWKLLDFAELKHSSVSYFDIEKHETAISRWSRARTRAAKVGKGLSKNDKAQKLALQHWLEAIDPRHRYGHNLHFYFNKWLECQSREPFFYWLDIGEGKEVNIVEKCPRSKLQQQCIKYLGPMERQAYRVIVEDGKFVYKQTGELLHTFDGNQDAKWIFVLSTSKNLYVSKKKKGTFQHSSFLAGGATIAAGRLVVENGDLKAVWPHSGHYRPTEENFKDFLSFLRENNVDLTDVKTNPVEEEDSSGKQRGSTHIRNFSEEDLTDTLDAVEAKATDIMTLSRENGLSDEQETTGMTSLERPNSLKLTNLEIPKKLELLNKEDDVGLTISLVSQDKDGYESEREENEVEDVPEESILRRINSKKETKSYQLGKQLSCKWTTGAGPRIGCVRDYPTELQFRALEQVNLSPRSAGLSRLCYSPRTTLSPRVISSMNNEELMRTVSSPLLEKMNSMKKSIQQKTQFSPLCRGASLPLNPDIS